MSEMYLQKDDLDSIKELMDAFGVDCVKITSDSSSGIGSIIKATVSVEHSGHRGEFTKIIADETTW